MKEQSAPPRSMLFVPGDRASELYSKGVASGPEAIIIDLEDAVSRPAVDEARTQLRALGRRERTSSVPLFVRVGAVASAGFSMDVEAALAADADGIVLAKCERRSDVQDLALALGDAAGSIPVVALLESARSILAATEIAGLGWPLVGLALGAEDLSADMKVARTRSGREIRHAREHLLLAARANGLWAIDTPCMEVRSAAIVRRECAISSRMGFDGKLSVHPTQIPAIHAAFSLEDTERRLALQTLNVFEAASARGIGATVLDGRLIDQAVAESAKRRLTRPTARKEGNTQDDE